MATCTECGCGHDERWGKHFCAKDLPEQPKEFNQTVTVSKGVTVPKCDYHDRKAWLEHVTGQTEFDWRSLAKAYRVEGEARACVAQAEEAVRGAMA